MALAPGASCTLKAVAGLPFKRVPYWYSCADFHPGDIAKGDHGAVGVGAQHNGGERFRRAQLAFDHHVGRDFLSAAAGQVANAARGYLGVLAGDGVGHVVGREVETDQFARVDPDAHGPFRAIQLPCRRL